MKFILITAMFAIFAIPSLTQTIVFFNTVSAAFATIGQ